MITIAESRDFIFLASDYSSKYLSNMNGKRYDRSIHGMFIISIAILLSQYCCASSITHCLFKNQITLGLYGYSGPDTFKIIDQLESKPVRAVFFMETHELKSASEAGLLKDIISHGHVLGLSLSSESTADSISEEGFRGKIMSQYEVFNRETSMKPLFVKVPNELSAEKISILVNAGFYPNRFGEDISIKDDLINSSNCSQILEKTLPGSRVSTEYGIIGMNLAPNICIAELLDSLMRIASDKKLTFVSMKDCLGVSSSYQSEKHTEPLVLNSQPKSPRRVENSLNVDSAPGGTERIGQEKSSTGLQKKLPPHLMIFLATIFLL
jgi:hypothetical protein